MFLILYLTIAAFVAGGAYGNDMKNKDRLTGIEVFLVCLICLFWPLIFILSAFKEDRKNDLSKM